MKRAGREVSAPSPGAPERAVAAFRRAYRRDPTHLVHAPGRVNLIGEHTDYNDGFVLPMALERAAWMAVAPRQDGVVRLAADDLGQEGTFAVDAARSLDQRGRKSTVRGRARTGWMEYPRGVAWSLQDAGLPLHGFDGALASDVPRGAGLSSSAAVELAVAASFAVSSGFDWDAKTMARLMQRVENRWIGVQSGIMDQLIAAAGVAGHALLIDCRELTLRPVPLPEDVAVVVLDTGTRRALVGSAYDDRRAACERVARELGVPALRDADEAMLDAAAPRLDQVDVRRARHVIRENARTLRAADALGSGDVARVGTEMDASHASMRDDFEISSPALNAMVTAARRAPGCLGARMTGGGFAGCAVALVRRADVERFTTDTSATYRDAVGRGARAYVTRGGAGAGWSAYDERPLASKERVR
ncbi:MAG: galactokinase [Trueperaceae bacterium]